jgi:hypothetical protein
MEKKLQIFHVDPHNEQAKGARDDLNKAMSILKDAPKDPKAVNAIAGQALWDYYVDKAGAEGAAQVSQLANEQTLRLNVLQVQQNQRIIELLEQVAKSGTGGESGHDAVAKGR